VPCFAGHCDWRLPNIIELQSLIDYSATISAVFRTANDGTGNSATQAGGYWSSTSLNNDPSRAWIVSFDLGYTAHDSKEQRHLFGGFVRAVRGGS
jgi:hypothetical protein